MSKYETDFTSGKHVDFRITYSRKCLNKHKEFSYLHLVIVREENIIWLLLLVIHIILSVRRTCPTSFQYPVSFWSACDGYDLLVAEY